MNMDNTLKPVIAKRGPFAVDLEKGKRYAWCTCGRSASQPFCDGSHRGSEFKPHLFVAEETKTAYLCGCKHTANPPFCDGTHAKLS